MRQTTPHVQQRQYNARKQPSRQLDIIESAHRHLYNYLSRAEPFPPYLFEVNEENRTVHEIYNTSEGLHEYFHSSYLDLLQYKFMSIFDNGCYNSPLFIDFRANNSPFYQPYSIRKYHHQRRDVSESETNFELKPLRHATISNMNSNNNKNINLKAIESISFKCRTFKNTECLLDQCGAPIFLPIGTVTLGSKMNDNYDNNNIGLQCEPTIVTRLPEMLDSLMVFCHRGKVDLDKFNEMEEEMKIKMEKKKRKSKTKTKTERNTKGNGKGKGKGKEKETRARRKSESESESEKKRKGTAKGTRKREREGEITSSS